MISACGRSGSAAKNGRVALHRGVAQIEMAALLDQDAHDAVRRRGARRRGPRCRSAPCRRRTRRPRDRACRRATASRRRRSPAARRRRRAGGSARSIASADRLGLAGARARSTPPITPSRLAYSLPLPIISDSRSVLHSSAARAPLRAAAGREALGEPAARATRAARPCRAAMPRPSIHTTPASASTRSAGVCLRSVSQ